MPILIIFILFVVFPVFSALSPLSCSKNGLQVVAINGVNIDDSKFNLFKDMVEIKLRSQIDSNKTDVHSIEFTAYHNHSLSLLNDAYETWKLYIKRLEETTGRHIIIDVVVDLFADMILDGGGQIPCKTYNLQSECNDLLSFVNGYTQKDLGEIRLAVNKALNDDKKLLFLSHSAGALFVDTIRDDIKIGKPQYYNLTSHLALARPFKSKHDKVFNIELEKDEIINGLRLISEEDVPQVNVYQRKSCVHPTKKDPAINHDFIYCYMSKDVVDPAFTLFNDTRTSLPSFDLVLNSIYRVASYLENNDENCCNGDSGKIWVNSNGWPGGFVSDKTHVIGNYLTLHKGSQLCGKNTLDFSVDKYRYINGNSILDGTYNFPDEFTINNLKMTSRSKLEVAGEAFISDSTIDGSLIIKAPLYGFAKLNLVGNLEIVKKFNFPETSGNRISNVKIKTGLHDFSKISYIETFKIENSEIYAPLDLNLVESSGFDGLVLTNSKIYSPISALSSVSSSIGIEDSEITNSLIVNAKGLYFKNSKLEAPVSLTGNYISVESSSLASSVYHQSSCDESMILFKNIKLNGGNSFNSGSIYLYGGGVSMSDVSGNSFNASCDKSISVSSNSSISGSTLQKGSSLGSKGSVSGVTTDTTNGNVTAYGYISAGTHFIGSVVMWYNSDPNCLFSGTVQPGTYCYPPIEMDSR